MQNSFLGSGGLAIIMVVVIAVGIVNLSPPAGQTANSLVDRGFTQNLIDKFVDMTR